MKFFRFLCRCVQIVTALTLFFFAFVVLISMGLFYLLQKIIYGLIILRGKHYRVLRIKVKNRKFLLALANLILHLYARDHVSH